jgi:hypothetical protein
MKNWAKFLFKVRNFLHMNFNAKQLSEIDVVEIVNLRGINPDRVSEYMKFSANAPHVKVENDSAQQLASLWRQLPSGIQARCHIPPYGLRFYFNNELQLQASICWECDNIFGDVKGENFSFAFDAQHKISQQLFSFCKQAFDSI